MHPEEGSCVRFAIVDFECTSLKSDQGILLCAGIKELGRPSKVIGLHEFKRSLDKLKPDKYLAAAIRDQLESFDVWVTWNGKMFDVPFLQDRLMLCDERKLERRKHIDVMYYARAGQSRLSSSKLDWVARQLELPVQKTSLDLKVWKRAEIEALERFKHGRDNYDYIIEHCKKDLKVTEKVYERLAPRIMNIHV